MNHCDSDESGDVDNNGSREESNSGFKIRCTDLLLEVTKKVGVDVVNGLGRLREMRQVKENKDLVGGETSGYHVLC